jgi:hypothetical protein
MCVGRVLFSVRGAQTRASGWGRPLAIRRDTVVVDAVGGSGSSYLLTLWPVQTCGCSRGCRFGAFVSFSMERVSAFL